MGWVGGIEEEQAVGMRWGLYGWVGGEMEEKETI